MKIPDSVEILLVEDGIDDAKLAIRALKKINIINSILHVDDGQKALDYIFCNGEYTGRDILITPKLILLDLHLPKKNGFEVLEAIKNDERVSNVPVVLLTSSQEEEDISKGYNLGVNSYIIKPVDFTKFAKAIVEIGYYWLVLNSNPNET
jgi:CheY-like chemotaxis protein